MKQRLTLFLVVLSVLTGSSVHVNAQDTTFVQTLTFDSLWNRSGKWYFPTANQQYRKVLMYYTLKCYNGVSGDGKYPCGEWDYLAHINVRDHRGKMDSTLRTGFNFSISGQTPDSFRFSRQPVFNYVGTTLSRQQIPLGTPMNDITPYGNIGSGTIAVSKAFRAQMLLQEPELIAAGAHMNPLKVIRLHVAQGDALERRVTIRFKTWSKDSFEIPVMENSGWTTVYDYPVQMSSPGWMDFALNADYNYSPGNHLLVDIAIEGPAGSLELSTFQTNSTRMLLVQEGNYALRFPGNNRDRVLLDKELLITGNKPRTYEFWARIDNWNGRGGLFTAGKYGTSNADFALTTDEAQQGNGRLITWGNDVTFPLPGYSNGSWNHYALSYDGKFIRTYFNGRLVNTTNRTLNTEAGDHVLGAWHDGNYFNGAMTRYRVWEKALDSNTLQQWRSREPDMSHSAYDSLLANYALKEGSGTQVLDQFNSANTPAVMDGAVWWERIPASASSFGVQPGNDILLLAFQYGNYPPVPETTVYWDSVAQQPSRIVVYGNPGSNAQIRDENPLHPSLSTDTLVVWNTDRYSYRWLDGQKIDSSLVTPDSVIYKQNKSWYSNTVNYEIGRHITPYGINLSLGQGFRWVYDVTDYYPLLQDTVDLTAGGTQELTDVKFLFIKGTPAAPVKKISNIWEQNMYSYSYSSVSNNTRHPAVTLNLEPSASVFRVKTRITGHGHASNDGSFPHCCEWKDNEHRLLSNGNEIARWKVFQYNECAENPLFPQGGTWPGAREGWCPGDLVKDVEFDVSSQVSGSQLNLDYDITPVPTDNLGMGNGNYVYAMQLIQYGQPSHNNDADLYEIQQPTDWEYYSRVNPVCRYPKVVLRNAGKNALTSVKFSYQVSGGTPVTYTWQGNLALMEKTTVELPIPGTAFWNGDGKNRFLVEILEANGGADDYAENNKAGSSFRLPDIFPERTVVLTFKTNNTPQDNKLILRDFAGNEVKRMENLDANKLYNDTVYLDWGCYSLELIDEGQDGLNYWANPNQGTGYFRIRRPSGAILKNFNADFGRSIYYQFAIGSATTIEDEPVSAYELNVYPNPAREHFQAEILTPGTAPVYLELYTLTGQLLEKRTLEGATYYQQDFKVQTAGMYLLQVKTGDQLLVKKVVVE